MFATRLPDLDAAMDQATEDVAPAWGVLPVEQYLLVHQITLSYSFYSPSPVEIYRSLAHPLTSRPDSC